MLKLRRKKQSVHPRRGTIIALFPFLMAFIIFLAAIMVDLGAFYVSKSQMQNASDAAALAAAMRVGNKRTDETTAEAIQYASEFANYNLVGKGDVLVSDDIVFGKWDHQTESFSETSNQSECNAYQVTVRRGAGNSEGLKTYFSRFFGFGDIEASATSTAVLSSASSAIGIPVGLRDPEFGAVWPRLSRKNSNLNVPSEPFLGNRFQYGDEVAVLMYSSDEDNVALHLTLAYDDQGVDADPEDVVDILNGDSPNIEMQVGDEVKVLSWGGKYTGDGDEPFGKELVKRLSLDSDDPGRTVVLPIVEVLDDSRNNWGVLKGDVRIGDFVGVYLTEIKTQWIRHPYNNKWIKVDKLMGTVVPRREMLSPGGATPSGVGGGTVAITELVY